MLHRHLTHSDRTLAAVDDIIARGRFDDWNELRDELAHHEEVRRRVLRVCAAYHDDPYAQRYHLG